MGSQRHNFSALNLANTEMRLIHVCW